MRGPILLSMKMQLSSISLEDAEATILAYYRDVESMVTSLRQTVAFEMLTDDIDAILYVFKAFLNLPVLASEMRATFKRLQEPRNAKAMELFEDSGNHVGELTKSSADKVVQRSVKDAAGDDRFDSATKALAAPQLPSWNAISETEYELLNAEGAFNGMVHDVLQESSRMSLKPSACGVPFMPKSNPKQFGCGVCESLSCSPLWTAAYPYG